MCLPGATSKVLDNVLKKRGVPADINSSLQNQECKANIDSSLQNQGERKANIHSSLQNQEGMCSVYMRGVEGKTNECFISRQAVAVLESHASRLLSQQDMSYGSFEKLMSDWPDMSTRQRPFCKKW